MDQIILEVFWKTLPKAILFSLLFFFLGLVLGVVMLVWLHKKQLLKRETPALKILNEEIVDAYLQRNAARANNSATRLILKKALDYSLGKGKERDKKLTKIKKTGGKFLANQVYSVVENLGTGIK